MNTSRAEAHTVRRVDAIGAEELDGWCNLKLAVSREKTEEHHHGRVTGLLD